MKVVATPGAEDVVAGMGAGGVILLVLLFLVAMAFLAPLFLQIAVWLVTKQKPKYKETFFTNLKLIGANVGGSLVLGFVLGFVSGFVGVFIPMNMDVVKVVAVLGSLPLTAYFYGYFIRLPETGRIGIGKGALVMLTHFLLAFGVIICLVILGMLLTFLGAMGR
jgi:hypothetical protein